MEPVMWNPWHGCHKISEGCKNCYMYQRDAQYGINSSVVKITKTKYNLPISIDRYGNFKVESGSTVAIALTSDFFIEEADAWREDVWKMIKIRDDLEFFIITKRVNRVLECLPTDWGDGYNNVRIDVTVENQKRADERIPMLMKLPLKKKGIMVAPILEEVDVSKYLLDSKINIVSAGGESGDNARVCEYDWVLSLRNQCIANGVSFNFHQTGTKFKKDSRLYLIPKDKEKEQAEKSNLNYNG